MLDPDIFEAAADIGLVDPTDPKDKQEATLVRLGILARDGDKLEVRQVCRGLGVRGIGENGAPILAPLPTTEEYREIATDLLDETAGTLTQAANLFAVLDWSEEDDDWEVTTWSQSLEGIDFDDFACFSANHHRMTSIVTVAPGDICIIDRFSMTCFVVSRIGRTIGRGEMRYLHRPAKMWSKTLDERARKKLD